MQVLVKDPLGLVGKLLDRKYRVDARVAEGGFAVVYAGHHLGLGRPLAIKVLPRAPGDSPGAWGELVADFLEEARLVARLRHPAVVSVLDAGIATTDQQPEGLPWIAMEWIDGETLADELARRRAQGLAGRTPGEALALLRPVVEAIAEAHEVGIVHRDLKPDNLMLAPGPRGPSLRVLDFGIAKLVQPEARAPSGRTTTETAARAFSPAYAAPEQLSGGRTGPWTDVHALALLFTEVLCGTRGIADDDIDLYYRAAFDPTRPTPGTRGVDVGPWEAILARALALRSQDRYGSAGELLAALDQAEAAPPAGAAERPRDPDAAAEPSDAPRQDRTSRRRSPLAVASAAGALIVAAAGLVLAVRHGATIPATPPATAPRSGEPGMAAPAAGCTSNAACRRPGAPAICRPGIGCVPLRSQDCEPMADPRALDSDRTVWFGTMFPLTGPDAEAFGRRETQAIELARRDFAQVMSGASTAGAFDRARPLGLVVCDDAADFHRAATHLVDTVGVPAVIGFYKSAELIDLATSLFLPRRVLAISSINSNPLITRVPHPDGVPRLIWRTTYLSTDAATAVSAWLATGLEPSLRGTGRLAGRALRVAV
ncbi:MAG TPA: bifunctional serine/threonine-protein kinase/ABC transporter substrate-binding protein, partial [Kofleriaceae bacterium]|nr:bifunctional serine/threonine-protein kinase/ABC transporter substrate-binding protein [Kofleriaceae bacterium]